MISIEKFNIKYLDDVYKIECACFAHPWSKKDLENQLSLDTSHFLVALENEKAGFENVGIRPHFYTSPDEDAVIMTKNFEKGENI